MDVVEGRLRQVVEMLMCDHERPAVGREGHPANVVRRNRADRSIDRRVVSTTASRPPKASATTSFEPSAETDQFSRAKRQLEIAEERELGRLHRPVRS